MQIRRTVVTAAAPAKVFAYLSDFTTTTSWDPGTVQTTRLSGGGGVGTVYRNVSRFAGKESQVTYVVTDHEAPALFALRGENATVVVHDTMRIEALGGGSRVVYTADFEFKGLMRPLAVLGSPCLSRALRKLGNEAEVGLSEALSALPATA